MNELGLAASGYFSSTAQCHFICSRLRIYSIKYALGYIHDAKCAITTVKQMHDDTVRYL